jgi:flagella basal body P-ring formation protein FlgA
MRQGIAASDAGGGKMRASRGYFPDRMNGTRLACPLYMLKGPSRICRSLFGACCAAALAWGAVPAASPDFQDTAVLEDLAKTEAARHLPPLTDKQRLAVAAIQRAQQLPRCGAAVQSSVAPGIQVSGRVLVELRCESGKPWHIYVPVKVVGTSPVAVTTHAIVAGSLLKPNDVVVEQRDLSELPPGYLNSAEIAVGLTASRAISGGTILTNQELLGIKAVQRGQTVTLVASNGDFSVRMAGRALSDGLVNQRIRVENLSSGKIVEGIARSEQVVEIVFQ